MVPRLSIIVPTVSRSEEFRRFLETLKKQSHLDLVELIIVDQNKDNRISKYILDQTFQFSIQYLQVEKISLSYAKNKGLERASGTFCCFLDDDCWMHEDFLKNIFPYISQQDESGYLLKAVTPEGCFLVPSKLVPGFKLNVSNIKESFYAPQIAQVYPTSFVKDAGGFNARLGIGTEFGSAEDTDLLVRIVNKGISFTYLDQVQLFHPEVDYASMTPQKSYQYGLGFGAFCKIHGWKMYWIYKMIRSLGGVVVSIIKNQKHAQSYFKTLQGRWKGYWSYQ
jgi:glycosyltransferase involved in cell wall biosynthesis